MVALRYERVPIRGNKSRLARCGTCSMFTGSGCTIHSPRIRITRDMVCDYYARGKPAFDQKGNEEAIVTPEQSRLRKSNDSVPAKYAEGGAVDELQEIIRRHK